MKKTLVAIASLAALGAMSTSALAQSSSSIYGNLDQTLVQTSQGGKSATSSASNNNSSSYWGITSTEDMGGGLKASFDLRSEITLMTGQAASTSTSATNAGQTSTAAVTQNTVTNAGDKPSFFNRGAFLKLASDNFGAITIGRQADAWWFAQGQVNTTTGASGGFGNLTAMQTNTTNTNLIGGANPTVLANYMGSATAAGANINPAYYPVSEAFMGGFRLTPPASLASKRLTKSACQKCLTTTLVQPTTVQHGCWPMMAWVLQFAWPQQLAMTTQALKFGNKTWLAAPTPWVNGNWLCQPTRASSLALQQQLA